MGTFERPTELELELKREQLHDLLSKHFRPAKSAADAHSMFTTEQFLTIIDEHSPGLVERELLRELLLKLGYQEQYLQEEFRWLVSQR